ncbi:unnamed protein product [Merluccius merluccius]
MAYCKRSWVDPSLSIDTFSEKVSSLGKEWHKLCLKCDRCNKLLTAGGHAEVSTVCRPITSQRSAVWFYHRRNDETMESSFLRPSSRTHY